MKTYIITVEHDNGETRIRVTARSKKVAVAIIMEAEGCPESAIKSVSRL